MDYIQKKWYKRIEKTKERHEVKYSTIVGCYNVLFQYQLYLMFACVWNKREDDLSPAERFKYLGTMKRASLGTILNVIVELDACGKPILGVDKKFQDQIGEFIKLRNRETAHGNLVPGVHEGSYQELAEKYESIQKSIKAMNIPILSEDCRIYYMPENGSEMLVIDNDDYNYQYWNEGLVKNLELQPGELHYYCNEVYYRISPFLILREIDSMPPYEIYCYQEYNLKNGKFEYKGYSDLPGNSSYSKICKDYFLSFQTESLHTISKANGVICNKFENNYDYFISTTPIDSYEQKVWQFIKSNKSNACLTIRGGGGIGKTALVQYVCTKNVFEPFDMGEIQYVIFCSAKDREFKQSSSGVAGNIRSIQNESVVRCYEDIIRTIAWVIDFDTELKAEADIKAVEDALVNKSGILLIVDDFETLSEEDKKKVVTLSSRLDVTKHKMIITTRSQYMVGEEYYITGLDRAQTICFMKEWFKQGYTEAQYKNFENFVQDKEVKKKIFELTKGLPMLAIQLGSMLIINGFNEKSLIKRDNEEIEDFLLGRLYSYFGTITSKILFLIVANFFQYGNDEVAHTDLQTMYALLCERLNIANVDYEQDLNELKKLNIVMVETDFVRISNYISSSIIRQCQDELMQSEDVGFKAFDNVLFKSITERGIKAGVLLYCEKEDANIDYPFVKIFAFKNAIKLTNDVRFSIIEKYILRIIDNTNALRDLFRDACKYFDISAVESKFVFYSKKLGFIISELADKRDVYVDEEEVSAEYYLQEILSELEEQRDTIDDFIINRKKGGSQSFCLDTIQDIRGKLASICNVKLDKIFSLQLEGCTASLQEIKDSMDEISYTKEFSIKESKQYIRLEELLNSKYGI